MALTLAVLALVLAGASLAVAMTAQTRARSLEEDLTNLLRLHRTLQSSLRDLEGDQLQLERRIERAERAAHPRGGAAVPVPDDAHSAPRRPRVKRADPRVYVEQGRGTGDRVILTNRSEGIAREVRLEVECPDGSSPFPADVARRAFPVQELRRGVPHVLWASFPDGCRPPLQARLSWLDPDDTQRERAFPLTWGDGDGDPSPRPPSS